MSPKIIARIKEMLPASIYIGLKKLWLFLFLNTRSPLMRFKLRNFKYPQFKTIYYDQNKVFDILIDPRNGLIDNFIFMDGFFDRRVGEIISQNLKKGDTFIDIGANIGFFSLLACVSVGPEGKVVAFEPIKRIADQFLSSISKNKISNITLNQWACGSETIEKDMSINELNAGGSSLVESKNPIGSILELVKIKKLDDSLESISRADMIKVDVEGYEFNVLLGAENTITKYKPKMILEFSPALYGSGRNNIAMSLLRFLSNHGYTIETLGGKRLVKEDFTIFTDNLLRAKRQVDLFCYNQN
jgi:FkbM family methyltransferase